MRLLRLLAVGLVGAALCAGTGRADTPAKTPVANAPGSPEQGVDTPRSPIRLIPAQADLLIQVRSPRRLVELVRNLDILQQIQTLPFVKEQLGGTQARRARQLLAYAEKQLGGKWPKLLDGIAGGGAALGLKFGNDAPAVLVVQGTDEKMVEKFVDLAVEIVKDELARQEVKAPINKGKYHGIPIYHVGPFIAGRAGAAIVVSNNKDALERSLDIYRGKEKNSVAGRPEIAEAARLLPQSPLANLWVTLKPLHDSPMGKELYKTPRDNSQLTVLVGHYLDLFGRSPFFCAAVAEQQDGFLVSARLPRGRDGMGPDAALFLPPAGQPGSRPLLEPKGVLYSSSFYFDFPNIWKERNKLFPKVQADGITAFDKSSGRVLGGVKLSKLLESAGAYHRLVAVKQPESSYKKKPANRIPAFAFITEMREPDRFGRTMETALRAGGLIASTQFSMKLDEQTHQGFEIVGYRFDEKAELKQDVDNFRFNFSPCFVRVNDQFVFCSSIELCRDLVDLLVAEKKSPGQSSPARTRDRFYASGAAELLDSFRDTLITQTILDQAVPPGEAKEQVEALIKLIRTLGTLTNSGEIGEKEFRYDIRFSRGK
jgi:hypothetical protein